MPADSKCGIKDLAFDDRPREKLLLKGVSSLSDAELVAILLRSGSRKESAIQLAQKILKEYQNSFNELGKATVDQLRSKFLGIGYTKAVTIIAAMEIGRRRLSQNLVEEPVILTSVDAYNIFKPLMCDIEHEELWALFLNKANKIKAKVNITKGGIGETITDSRIIFKKALEINATAIILCHNHPSGNLTPSQQDIDFTENIIEAGNIMNIKILDHLIITNKGYFSFTEQK
jgi:DNA repair protein RadC